MSVAMEEYKTKKIQIRLSPTELEKIEAKFQRSKFTTKADFFRNCLLEKDTTSHPPEATSSPTNPQLEIARQLRPIGVNLNQIARILNSLNQEGRTISVKKVHESLTRLEAKLDQVRQQLER